MKSLLVVLLFLAFTSVKSQTSAKATELVKAMHTKYYQAPCKTYTFTQKNTHYRNDSLVGMSTWYEAIELPDKFRIEFGDRANKNYVLFKNDSSFSYKKGELTKKKSDENILLLLLGGMYYRDLDDVLKRLERAEFNLNKLSEQKWNNEDVYVIGAESNELNTNQIWINKNDFRVLRIIERYSPKDVMDIRFETHQPSCKGFIETRVSFHRNGKLEQLEEYLDITETKEFPW